MVPRWLQNGLKIAQDGLVVKPHALDVLSDMARRRPHKYNHMQCWCHCLGETQITTITCNDVVSACEKNCADVMWWQGDKMTRWQYDKMTRWHLMTNMLQGDKMTRWPDDKVTRHNILMMKAKRGAAGKARAPQAASMCSNYLLHCISIVLSSYLHSN